VIHAKHGEQFEIAKYESPPSGSEEKIAAFIGGGLIFGGGPSAAKKIARKFGREA
jgi:ATP-dependent exoDNAse (exonuclease V) alpha subunit